MLACTFGCHSLYEHGYIAVAPAGVIQVSPLAKDLPEVAKHIEEKLAGRTVTWWNEDREKYYQWGTAPTRSRTARLRDRVRSNGRCLS